MWYYVIENQICKYISNDVNRWLKEHNKHIKNIYCEDFNKKVIVEVK